MPVLSVPVLVGWRVVGCGDCGAVDEGTGPTLAPDALELAAVPVSDAVAAGPTWLADWEGPTVIPVSVGGWPPELSSNTTTATTPQTARPALPATSLRLVKGEPVVRSVPGSRGSPSSS